jgi:serine/threonine protein kinase
MTVADQSLAEGLPTLAPPPRPVASWYTQGHSDAIGDRLLMFDNTGTPSLELLRFRPEIVGAFGFEEALRERVHRLQRFTHPAFPEIRAIEYLEGTDDLTLVSTFTPGKRLSDVFRSPRAGLHPAFATWLIRELVPALSDLHQHDPGISHGAVTPERIVLTPDGRLMLVEHALGAALERIRWGLPGTCESLGIVSPQAPVGTSVFDSRTDVIQLGWLTLSVLLGRRLQADEYPDRIGALLDEFSRTTVMRSPTLVGPLRKWLERALYGEAGAFGAALEAGDNESHPNRESVLAWKPLLAENPETAMSNRATGQSESLEPDAPAGEQKPDEEVLDAFSPESPAAPQDPFRRPVFTGPHVTSSRPAASPPRDTQDSPGSGLSGFAPEAPSVPTGPPVAIWPETKRSEPVPASELSIRPDRPAPAEPLPAPVERFDEPEQEAKTTLLGTRLRPALLIAVLGGAVLVEAVAIGTLLYMRGQQAPPAVPITVESLQDGDGVVVDGKLIGVTPLKVDVGPGIRSIEIVPRAQEKPAFSTPPPVVAVPEPAATSPAAAAIAAAAAKQKSGGMKINSPIDIQVLEGDRVLGSSADGPIVASAGRHELDFINPAFGFRTRQQVDIKPGQIINLNVTPPGGRVSVNAIPWAQVFINGNLVGETPLANMPMPVGEHQVLFRHPQFGDRTEKVIVRSGALTRVSATLGQ